jgi:hypothetical protein
MKTVLKTKRQRLSGESEDDDDPFIEKIDPNIDEGLLELMAGSLDANANVAVSSYDIRGVRHYKIRPADQPLKPVYDEETLPQYLFVGAAFMTMGILVMLCRQLPDFFVRSFLWLRSWGRYRLRVVGGNNMPSSGPVILATNCTQIECCLQVLSVTDRFTRFLLLENHGERPSLFLRLMAKSASLAVLRPGAGNGEWKMALERAVKILDEEEVVGLPAAGDGAVPEMDEFLRGLENRHRAVIVPVFCSKREMTNGELQRVKVLIGKPLPPETPAQLVRREIEQLAKSGDPDSTSLSTTLTIPAASTALPTPPATDRPKCP